MWVREAITRALERLPERVPFEALLYFETPPEVLLEVKHIILSMFPKFDFLPFQGVFTDILKLFAGEYPGYHKCNTRYHDLNHTTDCLLVMARLMHGAVVTGIKFDQKEINLGLIAALMHDTGYIQSVGDNTGTGAKYTLVHIERSNDFMRKYFLDHGYPLADFQACFNFLRCTGLDVKVDKIDFPSYNQALLGKMLGTADLIGQMSDKNYLAKLPFLYQEFKEGGVPGFVDAMDLFKQTPSFWNMVKVRFATEFGQVDGYLRYHFRARWGIDQDFYRKAIERNMECLHYFLDLCANDYSDYPGCKDPAMVFL